MSITFNIKARPDKPKELKMSVSIVYKSTTASNYDELTKEMFKAAKHYLVKPSNQDENTLVSISVNYESLWDKEEKIPTTGFHNADGTVKKLPGLDEFREEVNRNK